MQKINRNWILVTILVITTIIITTGTLHSNSKQQISALIPQAERTPPQQRQSREEFYNQFPTADYDAPEDADPEKREKRRFKSKRYDSRSMVSRDLPLSDDEEDSIVVHPMPISNLPGAKSFIVNSGLPAMESEIIVLGEILNGDAHLSNNKQAVYSEFTVRIDEIFKNSAANLFQGNTILIDREGGFVRYKNGKRRLYRINGFAMPRIGHRYIFFLNHPDNSPNYRILAAYELKMNQVESLNDFPQFMIYNGMDINNFIQAVHQATIQSQQARPN